MADHAKGQLRVYINQFNGSTMVVLEYVFRRGIFGAWMGRDDGHYCDVQSSGVNLFLVEGSKFLFHPLVTYRPI